MDIQWFPGHMAKTRKKLIDQLRWVDVVLEVADARLPMSSRNPLLCDLIGEKPKILLLNKADLADEQKTDRWRNKLVLESTTLAVSASTGLGMKKIVPQIELLLAGKMKALSQRGVRSRAVRVMVVGIPNIGKSSLINRLTERARAKTGNKPGVTRDSQWIRVHERVDLLDTPGMLWPKFDDQEAGRRLAVTGAIRDETFDVEELALWLLEWMKTNYPQELGRYGGQEAQKISLKLLGHRRGCLISGGEVDSSRIAHILLRDFRDGKMARVTLEEC